MRQEQCLHKWEDIALTEHPREPIACPRFSLLHQEKKWQLSAPQWGCLSWSDWSGHSWTFHINLGRSQMMAPSTSPSQRLGLWGRGGGGDRGWIPNDPWESLIRDTTTNCRWAWDPKRYLRLSQAPVMSATDSATFARRLSLNHCQCLKDGGEVDHATELSCTTA